MRSILRFLIFATVLVLGVVALYWWQRSRDAAEAESAKISALEEVDREFTSLVGRTLPSVVSINAVSAGDVRLQLLRRFFGSNQGTMPPQMGSGVVVSKEGHLVTNYHVVAGATSIEVILNDGRTMKAKFLGADELSDIAILQIEAENLTPLPWGDSDRVKVGQMVFAVGNPLGLQETVTQGIISAKGRRAASEAANEFFQTDVAINRGNSGGPLVSLRGELIGINSMVLPVQAQGIAFSIPSNTVRHVFESIRDHGRFIRPWFGAVMYPLTAPLMRQLGITEGQGAVVVLTYGGSPAEKAGLQPGDVIFECNGQPIRDHIDLRNRVAASDLGQTLHLKVLRKGQVLDLPVVISVEPSN